MAKSTGHDVAGQRRVTFLERSSMGIKWEQVADSTLLSGGGVAPFWICDTCDEKIQRVGNAVFVTDAAGNRTGEFLTIHKDKCETDYTRQFPWQDLDMFTWELFTNSGFDQIEIERRRSEGREFGLNN